MLRAGAHCAGREVLEFLPHPAQAACRAKAGLLGGAFHTFAALQPLARQRHAQAVLIVDDAQAGVLGKQPRQMARADVHTLGQLTDRPMALRVLRDQVLRAVMRG